MLKSFLCIFLLLSSAAHAESVSLEQKIQYAKSIIEPALEDQGLELDPKFDLYIGKNWESSDIEEQQFIYQPRGGATLSRYTSSVVFNSVYFYARKKGSSDPADVKTGFMTLASGPKRSFVNLLRGSMLPQETGRDFAIVDIKRITKIDKVLNFLTALMRGNQKIEGDKDFYSLQMVDGFVLVIDDSVK
jgi:hypothetical protein